MQTADNGSAVVDEIKPEASTTFITQQDTTATVPLPSISAN